MRYRLTLVVAGLAALTGVACNNDNITKVNNNPNSPTDAPAGAVFTYAVNNSVSRFMGSGYNLRGTGLVVQQFAQAQYPDEDQYKRLDANSTAGYFTGPYPTELEDYRQVINKGLAQAAPGVYGPAMVMQTWTFGYITETFGDVPYSAALRGDSTGGSATPAYDAQKDIYAGFFTALSKAVTDMAADAGSGKPTLGNADAIYSGSEAAWERFANSLRARYALRLVNVDPTTADAQLKAALAAPGGLLRSNADNTLLKWPGDGINDNPWSVLFQTRDDYRISNTLFNIMQGKADPRIPILMQPTQSDPTKYAGMPNGLSQSNAAPYVKTASRPGFIFYPSATPYALANGAKGAPGAKTPSYLMTFAEVSFIKAEAAERGLGGLTAAQAAGFYKDGITASMQQWGVAQAAIDAYIAQPSVTYAGGTPGLKQIATEKFVALYGDGGNAWAEWRRTCIPVIVPGPAAVVNYIPRRFYYPPGEASVNGTNLNAAIARQGPDNFGTRMYFDSKPTGAPTCQ